MASNFRIKNGINVDSLKGSSDEIIIANSDGELVASGTTVAAISGDISSLQADTQSLSGAISAISVEGGDNISVTESPTDTWTVNLDNTITNPKTFTNSVTVQGPVVSELDTELRGNVTIEGTGLVQVQGSDGIDYNPGIDTDVDIVTVGVGGVPRFWWDESENAFSLTHDLRVNGTSVSSISGDYVNVSGDTMTGDLVMDGAAIRSPVGSIQDLTIDANYDLRLQAGRYVRLGSAGVTTIVEDLAGHDDEIVILGNNGELVASGTTVAEISGGISQLDADARYVNVSGDTMTGKLRIDMSSGTRFEILDSGNGVGFSVYEGAEPNTLDAQLDGDLTVDDLFANNTVAASYALITNEIEAGSFKDTSLVEDEILIADATGTVSSAGVKISDLVSSLEGLTGTISLSGGPDISISDNGSDTITISYTGTGGGASDFTSMVIASSNDGQSTNNSRSAVIFEDESVDRNGDYDPTTGRFTAPEAGQYVVMSGIGFASASTTAGFRSVLEIYKNSSTIVQSEYEGTDGSATLIRCNRINGIVDLAAGDYIEITNIENIGSSSLRNDSSYNWLHVYGPI